MVLVFPLVAPPPLKKSGLILSSSKSSRTKWPTILREKNRRGGKFDNNTLIKLHKSFPKSKKMISMKIVLFLGEREKAKRFFQVCDTS